MTLAQRILKLVGQYHDGLMTDEDFRIEVCVAAIETANAESVSA